MNKKLLAVVVFGLVAVAGCIGQTPGTTGATGNGLEITEFSTDQANVFSGRTLRVTMAIENQGEATVAQDSGLALLIIPSGWSNLDPEADQEYTKDLDPADTVRGVPADTKTFRWTATAPTLPVGQQRTDELVGRIYYDYSSSVRGTVWVYPESEAAAAGYTGLEEASFTGSRGPVSLSVSVAPDPPVVQNDEESFTLTIVAKNNGGGILYRTGAATDEDAWSLDAENDLNVLDVDLTLPEGLTLDSQDCLDDIQLIRGSTTIICDITVDTAPSARQAYAIQVDANYGYYVESTASVTISGR